MGRPEKPIDVEQVKKLAERGWSNVAIAVHFEVDESRIRRRFAEVIKESRKHGAAKLLDILWQRGVTEKDSKVLLNLADRIIGPVPKIRLSREEAIKFLEEDAEQRGLTADSDSEEDS